jgi:hydrogenase maturation protease
MERVLVYGYGNPGRRDDGLGPALVEALSARGLGEPATLETAYQLQIEDAATVAEHDVVVFADADRACAEPFALRPLPARRSTSFSTHSIAPGEVLALAREHFGRDVTGFVLGVRGYDFDGFGESLSPRAQCNLDAAVDALTRALREGRIASAVAPAYQER